MNARHEPRPQPEEASAEQTDRLRRMLVHTSHSEWAKTYADRPLTVDDLLDTLGALVFAYERVKDDRDALLIRYANTCEICERRHVDKKETEK